MCLVKTQKWAWTTKRSLKCTLFLYLLNSSLVTKPALYQIPFHRGKSRTKGPHVGDYSTLEMFYFPPFCRSRILAAWAPSSRLCSRFGEPVWPTCQSSPLQSCCSVMALISEQPNAFTNSFLKVDAGCVGSKWKLKTWKGFSGFECVGRHVLTRRNYALQFHTLDSKIVWRSLISENYNHFWDFLLCDEHCKME